MTENDDLITAVLSAQVPVFHPHTGEQVKDGVNHKISPSARAGYEAPRYCQLCGRRLVVQVRPDGWWASCSRHGELDSVYLDRR